MHPLLAVVLSAPAAEAGDPTFGWLFLAGLAALYSVGYTISIRLHPYRNCRRCQGSRKHRGAIFTRSFRACDRCDGTGRELRLFAKHP
ncbi:hypothetical protein AB0K48_00625 [Nonomuraea sp. NPDC055795]|uniref:Uncharacterized protein n=1 Tax=Nonomuraea endophytica TaxID=714136 RepID=A0A7W8EMI5_9ACTN|nr:hypothetical protein [Nonomuraea endophytica]MBB5085044.1 hypothetical protein [Nonomuraea endophytica]